MRVETSGATQAAERIKAAADRMKQLEPMFVVLGEEARELARNAFETERGPSGRAWRPRALELDGATSGGANRARRTARAAGDALLQKTGALLASIVVYAVPHGFEVAALVPYAKVHQRGTPHVRARPFLPLTRRGPLRTGPGGNWIRMLPARLLEFVRTGRT